MSVDEILNKIFTADDDATTAVNRMGCSENWYNPFYAIRHTFYDEEISGFGDETLEALVKLGSKMSEALY